MTFSRHVDNGPRKRLLNSGAVLVGLCSLILRETKPRGFDYRSMALCSDSHPSTTGTGVNVRGVFRPLKGERGRWGTCSPYTTTQGSGAQSKYANKSSPRRRGAMIANAVRLEQTARILFTWLGYGGCVGGS